MKLVDSVGRNRLTEDIYTLGRYITDEASLYLIILMSM